MKVLNISYARYESDSRIKKIVKTISDKEHTVWVVALTDDAVSKQNGTIYLCGSGPIWLKKFRLLYLLFRYFSVFFQSIKLRKCVDLVVVNDISTWLIFVYFKAFSNAQIWYDCHEYSPNDYPDGKWKEKTWVKVIEKHIVKKADVVTVVSEGIRASYQLLYRRSDIHVLRNIPILRNDHMQKPSKGYPNKKIDVVYQGVYSQGRGIEALLSQIAANAEDLGRYRFNFFGGGSLDTLILAMEKKFPELIRNHGWIDEESLEAETANMDIGYCVIEPLCKSYDLSLPNKFFQYCHSGIPILVGESKELRLTVSKYDLGVSVSNTGLVGALSSLEKGYDVYRRNCIEYASNNTWKDDFEEVASLVNFNNPAQCGRS